MDKLQSHNAQKTTTRFILMLSCPDQAGIVAVVAQFIHARNGNIVDSIQHNAVDSGNFYMRVEWDYSPDESEMIQSQKSDKKYHQGIKQNIFKHFTPIARKYNMRFQLWTHVETLKMAIFVSKQLHCLYDVILQWYETHLPNCEIVCVISNHRDATEICNWFDIPFHYISVTAPTKKQAEREQMAILRKYNVDLIILARYMQILTNDFVSQFPNQIINIHHSFLPAFVGAKPYHQAYARGVKIIGATSHYATSDLDQGPVIEQDVARISHRDNISDIIQKGKNLERVVLLQAIRMHIQRRVFVYGNKTVVFQ